MNLEKNFSYSVWESKFVVLFVVLLSNFYSQVSLSDESFKLNDIPVQCEKALEWYIENPQYKGEHTRVLEYCKKYAKDVSPEGFEANPILSDYGSMNGVNTRPRDSIHQGIDIIGSRDQPVIAIADGKVLEATVEDCWGATMIIDHGESLDGKKLITIYGHLGEFLVNENDYVRRGETIANLPKKIEYRCMARVRHLHLQIGQEYCKKEEKDNWGCKYFLKDFYRSLNPHDYWADGPNNVSCYEDNKKFMKGVITYPFACNKISN